MSVSYTSIEKGAIEIEKANSSFRIALFVAFGVIFGAGKFGTWFLA